MSMRKQFTSALMLLALIGCGGGAGVESIWKDPTAVGPKKNLLVVGLSDSQANRRTLEDNFTSTLTAHGNQASQSNPVVPSGREADKEAMTRVLREKGFDAVLTARAVAVDKDRADGSGSDYFAPPSFYYSYWDYYSPASAAVSAPGYYTADTFIRLETNLYDTGGKLIWTASTSSIEYGKLGEEMVTLADLLTTRLEKSGLIH